jgi:hypothetical protein
MAEIRAPATGATMRIAYNLYTVSIRATSEVATTNI